MALFDMLDAADDELRGYADLLERADGADLARPTPCEGWDVAELSDHVARVAFQQAEAFHRARWGITEPPGPATSLGIAPTGLPDMLRATADDLRDVVAAAGERRWGPVPLPFGTLPAGTAAAALVLEYGVHRYDLASSLGDQDVALSPRTAEAVLGLADGLLLLLARPIEGRPGAFRLTAPDVTVTLAWDGRSWSNAPVPGAPVCEVHGTAHDLALLVMRRIEVEDPRLDVDDPGGLAPRFDLAVGPL
ncbi:MAG TPA: maleylpyruvate isomerase family mycothiol-dependent enzyme [Aquihabitans sp.]|nr:maleylpyruvate isomerase family mycothiol-dependent enzyme [Aquihabitans sp.]